MRIRSNLRMLLNKTVWGIKLFEGLRGNFNFNSLSSPSPMQKFPAIDITWEITESSSLNSSHPAVIYIVSPTQRSGTNYLCYLLNLHKDVEYVGGENMPREHFLYSYSDKLEDYLKNTLGTWSKWIKNETVIDGHANLMMQYIGSGLLKYLYSFIENGRTLLLRTPDSNNIKNLPLMFPNCKLIILVRDGRETVASFMKSWGGIGAFEKMTYRWANRVDQILELKHKLDIAGRGEMLYIVKYENLNVRTREEVISLLNFLGLDEAKYNWEAMTKAPVLGSSTLRGEKKEVNWSPIEKTPEFNSNQKWNDWDESKKLKFLKIAGDQLKALDYL